MNERMWFSLSISDSRLEKRGKTKPIFGFLSLLGANSPK
jgi:hypothetical protein